MSLEINEYRKMDAKYSDDMEKLFGPTLIAFPEDCDSSRLYMLSSNLKQILNILKPDVARVQTGYEYAIGQRNRSYKKMEGTWEVVHKIKKYDNSNMYMMVLYNKELNQYDMVEKVVAEALTEKFGYVYNNDKMDSLEVGDKVTDEVLYKSSSYDDNMNYRLGKNATVMYVTDTSTIEDAVQVREGWAEQVKIVEVDEIEVSINSNDILLNIHGGQNSYKTFPDIGEKVNDCTVCAIRRVNLNHALYDFQIDRLNKVAATDVEYVTTKESMIYDIDIYYNGEDELPDNVFYSQLKSYYNMQCIYADKITEVAKEIKKSGASYTKNVSYYKAKYQNFTNKEYKWKAKDRAFANLIVKFKSIAVVSLQEGFKLTGRYGDKGIISNITNESTPVVNEKHEEIMRNVIDSLTDGDIKMDNVQTVPDSKMPYLEDGTRVDILLNTSGAIRRLNYGQVIEVELNFIGEQLRRHICTLKNEEDKVNIIFRFLEILNTDQHDFFLNMYNSYDRTETIDGKQIQFLNASAKTAFVKDIEVNGFYIIKRPDAKIRYDVMKQLYDEWTWIKPYTAYVDMFGIKKKQIMRPCVIGEKHMYLLKQTSNKNFSARSTGRIDKKGIPAKSNDKKINMSVHNRNPIKIGEAHNLFAGISGTTLAEYNLFMRSSPIARKSLKRIPEATGDPFSITKLKIKENYTNVNAEILAANFKPIGIELEFQTDDESLHVFRDYKRELDIRGFNILDKLSKKPAYVKLIDKYIEGMETFSFIGNINEKSSKVWDWVIGFEEMQEIMDENNISIESLKSITSNIQEKEVVVSSEDDELEIEDEIVEIEDEKEEEESIEDEE